MKKINAIVFVLIITLVLCFPGCGTNEFKLYIGVSQACEENTALSKGESVSLVQLKIKIENGQLVFQKNDSKDYDSLYLTFDGENIESVTFKSKNAQILNTNLKEHSYFVDTFALYKTVTGEELEKNFSDCYEVIDTDGNRELNKTKLLKKLWDEGVFDDIKNVYFSGENSDRVFNGMSSRSFVITGIGVNTNFSEDEPCKITNIYNSEANCMGEKTELSQSFIQWDLFADNSINCANSNEPVDLSTDDVVLQGDSVTVEYGENNSVRWVYEILYNEAMKNSSAQSKIGSDTVEIRVNYKNGGTEDYILGCEAFADGKIKLYLS